MYSIADTVHRVQQFVPLCTRPYYTCRGPCCGTSHGSIYTCFLKKKMYYDGAHTRHTSRSTCCAHCMGTVDLLVQPYPDTYRRFWFCCPLTSSATAPSTDLRCWSSRSRFQRSLSGWLVMAQSRFHARAIPSMRRQNTVRITLSQTRSFCAISTLSLSHFRLNGNLSDSGKPVHFMITVNAYA